MNNGILVTRQKIPYFRQHFPPSLNLQKVCRQRTPYTLSQKVCRLRTLYTLSQKVCRLRTLYTLSQKNLNVRINTKTFSSESLSMVSTYPAFVLSIYYCCTICSYCDRLGYKVEIQRLFLGQCRKCITISR